MACAERQVPGGRASTATLTLFPASSGRLLTLYPAPGGSFLEGELARRYRDAAPATLALLAERCGAAQGELAAAQAHLHAITDVPTLRRDGAQLARPSSP
jgi:hypothetical protein